MADPQRSRVRSVYGRVWAKPAQKKLVPKKTLEQIAQVILDSIILEGKKDLAKQGMKPTPRGQQEGLPVTEKFWRSFGFEIKGEATIEIYSTWITIDQLLEGRARFDMDWLRRTGDSLSSRGPSQGVGRVPMKDSQGRVIFRSTPGFGQDSWVHPGFRKHHFVERGIKKARAKTKEMLERQVIESLAKQTFKRR